MPEGSQFVVVALDSVEKTIQSKTTPRRVTDEDRRRVQEVQVFCWSCHDWFIYTEENVFERVEVKSYGIEYNFFVRCPCGTEKFLGNNDKPRAERNKLNVEHQRRQRAEKLSRCHECSASPSLHYCKVCDQSFCCEGGCPSTTKKHPTSKISSDRVW